MVSCTGISSSSVTRWTAVCLPCSNAMTPSLCRLIGPNLVRLATSLGRVEELGDPSGRRRVEHDGVVGVPLVGVGAGHRLLDLAGEQHVAQTRARAW